MALVMTPIYTQTASGSAQTISFNNIPQHFTDLRLVISSRSAVNSTQDYIAMRFNGISAGSLYSDTRLEGNGSSASSTRDTSVSEIYFAWVSPGATATANTFGSCDVYIPNYTSANFKSVLIDGVNENNTSTVTALGLTAGLFRSTSAISSLSLSHGNANFVANSTFSLYGIIRSGA